LLDQENEIWGACGRNIMNTYKILMGKHEGKKKYFEHTGFDRKVVWMRGEGNDKSVCTAHFIE